MVSEKKISLSPPPLLEPKPASVPALFPIGILILALFCLAFPAVETANAEEIIFSDDFQSGEISDEWVFFGDPTSIIEHDKGNPAPCFNNNGDSMYNSGILSRKTFNIESGLIIQCDIFLNCLPRGTWVNSCLGIYDPSEDRGVEGPEKLAYFEYAFSGELAWGGPHLQGVLALKIAGQHIPLMIHRNQWLNGWHTFKIEFSPEGLCSFSIDDSLISSHHSDLLDDIDVVGVVLDGRSTSWGIALHDNLLVYVP
ncbi:MAG: hypothetical protein KAS73_11060 [Candidatus Sabulitectum sp.]|nr:hypothetical protein [Candidatus Sabulitectum sp.]